MAVVRDGTVTFLFTDIEGSTRRWEANPDSMARAVARHDALLRGAIESHGGHVFKTVGDAFCAAFPTPYAALDAAIAIQQVIHREDWGDAGPLFVRVALHVGAVEQRDQDYFGPPLNRIARILSAAHGGQTLLSLAARELVADNLPPGASLVDLGHHRLKDLQRPEQVYQLNIEGLPAEFPPIRALDTRPNNLPTQPTPLVGREVQVSEAIDLFSISHIRLLTFVGPGGVGKTRLALEVAANLTDRFEDGVYFVNLAPISSAELVAPVIAGTLSVPEVSAESAAESLKDFLKNRQILLVLDNLEHLTSCAPLIADLLSVAPGLSVIATSREALRLRGEHEYPVPPLGLPDPKRQPTPDTLLSSEAARLFVQRAQAVKPGFAVSKSNAPALAEILYRLDGLPLAIELAAVRVKLFSVPEMLQRLQGRFKLLSGGLSDLPARQQNLYNTIEWSYELLDEREQKLFRRLSVFAGGCALPAAEAVCDVNGDLSIDLVDGMSSLVDKSLLRREETRTGTSRFMILETVREFGSGKLAESGEASDLRHRHAGYYGALLEEAVQGMAQGEQVEWLEQLDAEHDNFRYILGWSLAESEIEQAARLASRLWRYWYGRGYLKEGRQWLESVLSRATALEPDLRAAVLRGAGILTADLGDYQGAKRRFEEAVAIYRQLQDRQGIADCLNALGYVATDLGNSDEAEAYLHEALALYEEVRDEHGMGVALHNLGMLAADLGRDAEAEELYRRSLALSRRLDDREGIAWALGNLGLLSLKNGRFGEAEPLYRESLEICTDLHNNMGIALCLEGIAGVFGMAGRPYQAARLFGAAHSLRESLGSQLEPGYQALYDRLVAVSRSGARSSEWDAAWEEGRAFSGEQAVSYARQGRDAITDMPGGAGAAALS